MLRKIMKMVGTALMDVTLSLSLIILEAICLIIKNRKILDIIALLIILLLLPILAIANMLNTDTYQFWFNPNYLIDNKDDFVIFNMVKKVVDAIEK